MVNSELKNFTLVVPTKNRFYYVERLLKYYLNMDFLGTIIIIDSSDDGSADYIRKYVNNLNKENYIYKYSKGLPSWVIKENLDLIKTKYVSFLGDDDYAIPNGILKSIGFLENYPDISGCRGEGFVISDTEVPVESMGMYSHVHRLENKSSDRLIQHFSNYGTPFFHVMRAHIFKESYSSIPSTFEMEAGYDRLIGDELLASALMLVYGKFASIQGLHVVRIHSKEKVESRRTWGSVIYKKGRKIAVKDFTKKVATAIVEKDSITFPEAEEIAVKALKVFFGKSVNQANKLTVNTIAIVIKRFIRSLLLSLKLLNILVTIKNQIIVDNRRIGLTNILDPNNFYHKDFVPIYSSLIVYNSQNK